MAPTKTPKVMVNHKITKDKMIWEEKSSLKKEEDQAMIKKDESKSMDNNGKKMAAGSYAA